MVAGFRSENGRCVSLMLKKQSPKICYLIKLRIYAKILNRRLTQKENNDIKLEGVEFEVLNENDEVVQHI